jgi:hypothetical protein
MTNPLPPPYAEVPRDSLTAESPTITLHPWGEVRGRLMWGDQPGVNETVSIDAEHVIVHGFSPLIKHSAKTTTDIDGRFLFRKVPPGHAMLQREQHKDGRVDPREPWTAPFPHVEFHVSANEPTDVVVGGFGCPVIGKLVGRKDWNQVTVRILRPIRNSLLDTEELRNAYRRYRRSVEGKPYHPEKVMVSADGTFRFERVPGGQYQWIIEGPDEKPGSVKVLRTGTFYCPPNPTGTSDDPFVLRDIQAWTP